MSKPEAIREKPLRKTLALASASGLLALGACSNGGETSAQQPPTAVRTTKTPGNKSQPAPNVRPTAATPAKGIDVSFPQCETPMPVHSFAIVGVNGQYPNTINPCLQDELEAAKQTTGKSLLPSAMLYVTSANPGDQHVVDWPKSGENKYGACTGRDMQACAYEFGKFLARQDVLAVGAEEIKHKKVFVDVEPEYSWELTNQANNAAEIEGLVTGLRSAGAEPGIYSSKAIWAKLVGEQAKSHHLNELPTWVLGATDIANAQANCDQSFTDHAVVIAQIPAAAGGLDQDIACAVPNQ